MKGWYFSDTSKKLGYDDNRLIKLGRTHKIKGEPKLCEHGLHASKRIIDALQYAPGPVIWRVELSGKIVHEDDKSVATERTYLKGGINIDSLLRDFTRRCALDVVHLWNAPEEVKLYLKTGDESLRDAASAATNAAVNDAVNDAARDAAWAAAWAAASAASAACAAARDVAWATNAAASDAAWAASAVQNRRLTQMVTRAINNRREIS